MDGSDFLVGPTELKKKMGVDFFANIIKSMTNQQLKIDPMVFLDLINKING